MPNTEPPLDDTETIVFVQETAKRESPVRVLPIACVTVGRKGRGLTSLAELAELGVAGFSDDGSPVYDTNIMKKALIMLRDFGLPLIEHCEVPELAGDGVMNEGIVSSKLNLKGIPAAAEEQMVERDIRLARETGGWVHIAHASTAGTVELVRRGKSEGIRVTAEVTPHHLTLTEEKVIDRGAQAKVNPPLRTQTDIDALIEGLNDGTIDIIATDHAPHTKADKEGDMKNAAFGISGFETALGCLMGLVHSGRIPLNTLIEKMTRQPALILGKRDGINGTIEEGMPADLVIFDPEKEWTVNPEDFLSKGKNTPLAGVVLKGKVVATYSKGNQVYRNELV
jgi:dihydroorotase